MHAPFTIETAADSHRHAAQCDHLAKFALSDADRERVRLRLGAEFIEHVNDLWPRGEPVATPRCVAFRIACTGSPGCWPSG